MGIAMKTGELDKHSNSTVFHSLWKQSHPVTGKLSVIHWSNTPRLETHNGPSHTVDLHAVSRASNAFTVYTN